MSISGSAARFSAFSSGSDAVCTHPWRRKLAESAADGWIPNWDWATSPVAAKGLRFRQNRKRQADAAANIETQ
jgi:hypothetical protein